MALDHLPILDPAPDPRAFQAFQEELAALDTAITRAAAAMVADEREMLAERLRDGQTPPSSLLLRLATDDCSWSLPSASQDPAATGSLDAAIGSAYYEWKAATARLRQAGRHLQDYASVLARLADPKALSPSETAELERKLAALAQSGLDLGGALDAQAERKAAAGLVSMAASDLLRFHLKQRRGASLAQATTANDAPFRRYVESLRAMLVELHGSLRCHYINDSCDLLAAWDPAKAAAPAKKLLALNDNTVERLDAIAAILAILDILPAAHAALAGDPAGR